MRAERAFGWLLRLVPFDFRADYGREMEQVFGEEHRAAAARGSVGVVRLWWRAFLDVLRTAPREIAGVVGDVRHRGLDQPALPEMYVPHAQFLHFGQGLRLVQAGVIAGLVAAVFVSGLLQGMLFEVQPRDLGVLASVAALLLGVGAMASLLPALRAARADPAAALRED